MQIKQIRLISFRTHRETFIEFTPKVNLLYGANGVGKTNILEAIHYLALSKSFLAVKDTYALRKGDRFFELEATVSGEQRSEMTVRLAYMPDEGKRIFVNQSPLEKLSQVVGMIPVVIVAPSDFALTSEGPEVRRRFLNNILSQARPVYLDDMLQYRRVLKQRNVLLYTYRRSGPSSNALPYGVLDAWNAELVKVGSRIIASRIQFIERFREYMLDAYARIDAAGEEPTLKYRSSVRVQEVNDVNDEGQSMDGSERLDDGERVGRIAEAFAQKLEQTSRREREQGRTLVGPHRDELVFRINDMDVRRYASQGQHRTFGTALKLAQFFYLHAELDEKPVLLLDDLFGSLDEARTRVFLDLLQTDVVGQSIITATSMKPFDIHVNFDGATHRSIPVPVIASK